MSALLIAIACYIILDRLVVVGHVGKAYVITRAAAVLSIITGSFIVVVLLKAAYGGVAP